MTDPLSLAEAAQKANLLRENLSTHILGQTDLLTETLCCLLASGHMLMTGAPGLAKTTLVRVLSKHLQLTFRRVQCTPDLLPSDILGSEILNLDPETQKRFFEFKPGPIFTHLLLTDEINRASPRTQSALLEAMQEQSVTVAGHRHILEKPFMVFATQNPFESEGTFPLPEAQLDRFLVHTLIEYPQDEDQLTILHHHAHRTLIGENLDQIEIAPTLEKSDISNLQACTRKITVPSEILRVVNELVNATRPQHPLCPPSLRSLVQWGAGPRAGLSLLSAAQALALLEGQSHVGWKQIKRMLKPVFRHRMRLQIKAARENYNVDQVLDLLLAETEQRYAASSFGLETPAQKGHT